ncbi:lipopolysaccharide assembly protein LapB [Thalassobius sp. Cn5-15]|uniref:tetratricopeptide repeat protein n=1 Tax=Thalassobius sp. Cn5-15 TaxID=2917763 RepID=UPI001EF32140|nr:tetratricopeptide repeat protein [Thalassobius sp. Cn5-15]MCG7493198.1 tetratricopeptide repeat protein [Thalassobius sp. Cn5-15]
MRHLIRFTPLRVTVSVLALFSLSACDELRGGNQVDRAISAINAVDENNLSDIMLTVADADEAVRYFQRASQENPGRIDLKRGLAQSLVRASRATESVAVWRQVTSMEGATQNDAVDMADAMIRSGQWDEADRVLDSVPPTVETYKRYRLEAMVADSNKEWQKSDSFYETAVGLTTRPAGVLNNWGYSKLTRGDYADAERLFAEAIKNDQSLFTAKNNIVLARGAQRNYSLPVIPMSQIERAQLLHTMGLSAVKQGDVRTGESLLREAIDTHPQHFEAAVRALRALES